MKKVVTENDIKALSQSQEKSICIDENTIITPAAKDAAKQLGITFVHGSKTSSEKTVPGCAEKQPVSIDHTLITKLVEEVIKRLAK